jgi:trehalose 6-phosphate phosphatase
MEARPPVRIDKGAGVASLLKESGVTGAVYVGDDVTDLDAFRALTEMQQSGRLRRAVKAGVSSDDGPSEITSEADIVVDGTSGVQELLATLISDD